jgi:Flp pilus assembly protein TadG
MFSLGQWVQGVEWIWLVWLASLAIVFKLSCQALRRWRRPRWGVLARGEEGVSYSLAYVLVIPFYMLFVCVVFETTWLLLAKVGTMYAAHAGARSAVVWKSAQPANLQTPRINQSVWTAMTPFTTGSPSGLNNIFEALGQAADYELAYGLYSRASSDANAKPGLGTMGKRYLNAASRTTCDVGSPQPDGTLTVTVTYRAPLHIPGAARILNPSGWWTNEYAIRSTAKLPNEAPASANGTLGIDYQSR